MATGYMNYFVFEYLEKHRRDYEDFTLDQFVSTYFVSDQMAQEFIEYAQFKDTEIDFTSYLDVLKLNIKMALAEQLFSANAAQRIANTTDPMVAKVVALSREGLEEIKD